MALSIIRRRVSKRGLLTLLICILSNVVIDENSVASCSETSVQRLVLHGDQELSSGHFSNAHSYYLSALARNPYDVTVILKVASAEEKMGDLDSAIKRARLATQIEPNSLESHLELANYLEVNRDPKAAELQYERAVELTRDKTEVPRYEVKAIQLLIDLDDLEKADRLSLSWLQQNKKSADCHFNRGLVLSQSSKQARLQEAVKEFKQTLAMAPRYNDAHYQLGLLYPKLDQKDAGKDELETFIKTNPSADKLAQAREKLSSLSSPP